MRVKGTWLALLLVLWSLLLAGCTGGTQPAVDLGQVEIGQFRTEQPWVELNGNQPDFAQEEYTTEAFETYAPLDALGRCGTAYANLCPALMPTQPRGEIGQVKPAGWHTVKYDWVDGKYLYNRCHLIGYQLAGENANERNLITGTRFLNTQGMLPFENQVADYIEETGNHVLYRVTPVYDGADLLAWGVQMEAYSVEDQGAGVCFNVLCFNAEPGVAIDYATGASWADEGVGKGTSPAAEGEAPEMPYVLNTSSMKFHLPDCAVAARIAPQNRRETTASRQALLDQGYTPCGSCGPERAESTSHSQGRKGILAALSVPTDRFTPSAGGYQQRAQKVIGVFGAVPCPGGWGICPFYGRERWIGRVCRRRVWPGRQLCWAGAGTGDHSR